MRIVLSGGTGVLGRASATALVGAGHEVLALTRRPAHDAVFARLGIRPVPVDLFDADALSEALTGADAAINLATRVPVGYTGTRPGAWRANDRLQTEGVATFVAAARRAGVRRVVQQSVTTLYADQGQDWVDEGSPLEITRTTEPAAVAEAHVQDYACGSRVGVVLRLGSVVGDDPTTRFWLRVAEHGRPVGIGAPDSWAHLIHTDDLGSAVLAALHAPSGVYNVGADPVRRDELVAGFAAAAGASGPGSFMGSVMLRLVGQRAEPLGRSLRVRSEHFTASTGWSPRRAHFRPDWLVGTPALAEAR